MNPVIIGVGAVALLWLMIRKAPPAPSSGHLVGVGTAPSSGHLVGVGTFTSNGVAVPTTADSIPADSSGATEYVTTVPATVGTPGSGYSIANGSGGNTPILLTPNP